MSTGKQEQGSKENGIFLGFAGVESMVFLGGDGDGWELGQSGIMSDAGKKERLILPGSEGLCIPLGVRKCLGTHSKLAVISFKLGFKSAFLKLK